MKWLLVALLLAPNAGAADAPAVRLSPAEAQSLASGVQGSLDLEGFYLVRLVLERHGRTFRAGTAFATPRPFSDALVAIATVAPDVVRHWTDTLSATDWDAYLAARRAQGLEAPAPALAPPTLTHGQAWLTLQLESALAAGAPHPNLSLAEDFTAYEVYVLGPNAAQQTDIAQWIRDLSRKRIAGTLPATELADAYSESIAGRYRSIVARLERTAPLHPELRTLQAALLASYRELLAHADECARAARAGDDAAFAAAEQALARVSFSRAHAAHAALQPGAPGPGKTR